MDLKDDIVLLDNEDLFHDSITKAIERDIEINTAETNAEGYDEDLDKKDFDFDDDEFKEDEDFE